MSEVEISPEQNLMEQASARHAARMAVRLADQNFRKALSKLAVGHGSSSYVRTDSILRHCA